MNGKSFTDTLKEVQSRSGNQADTATDQLAPDLVDLDGAYQAHARPSNKSVQSIHCLLGKEGVRSSSTSIWTRTASSTPGTAVRSSWCGSPG